MNTRRSSPSAPRFATTCALLLLAHSAQAAAYDWTAASGATWATGWTGGNVPTTSDDLTVLGPLNTAGVLNIDVAGTAAAKTINFTDPSAVTLTNVFSGADKTLTIQSGLTTGAGAVTIGSATANQGVLVALGASQTWNIGSGGLTINNTISGASFGITKSGTGTLTLNGANTYGGTTVINAGTLIANGDTAGVLASGKAFTLAGGTFNYTSSNGSANTQTIGTVSITAGANTIQSTQTGAGSSTLTVGNLSRTATTGTTLNVVTTAGASIINSTALTSNQGVFFNGNNYATNNNTAGGTLRAINYGVDANSASVAAGGTASGSTNYLLLGNASGAGGSGTTYKFNANGSTFSAGGSSFIGGFLVSGGFTNTVTGGSIRPGNTVDIVVNTNASNDKLILNSSIVNFNSSTVSPVTKTGAGVLQLNGTNTYNGLTSVNQGTVQSTTGFSLGFGGQIGGINVGVGTTSVAAGATLDLAPSVAMTVNEPIILNGANLTNSGTGTATIDNGIAGVNLTNLGSGGSAVTGTVTFGGTGSGATATIVVAGGAITSFTENTAGTGYTGATPVLFTIAGQTTASAATAVLSSVTLNGTANTIGGSGNLIINAVVANGTSTGGFSKIGAGTVTLNGANTYTGTTTVTGGTLALGAADRIADTSNLVMSGGTFATGGFNETLGTLTLTAASTIDLGALASALVFADSSGTTWSSSVTLSFINFNAGTDSIRIGTTSGGLTGGQLGQITINGLAATIDSNGFITSAVPEPATYAALTGVAILGFALRRRRIRG